DSSTEMSFEASGLDGVANACGLASDCVSEPASVTSRPARMSKPARGAGNSEAVPGSSSAQPENARPLSDARTQVQAPRRAGAEKRAKPERIDVAREPGDVARGGFELDAGVRSILREQHLIAAGNLGDQRGGDHRLQLDAVASRERDAGIPHHEDAAESGWER